MDEAVLLQITKAQSRKSLYHFTRAKNLKAIAHFDTLFSSYSIQPFYGGARRLEPEDINYHDQRITINSHLRIADSMIDASTTQEQFRAYLDRHVFLWPTLKDCQKMMATYARREPNEAFAVLEFDAYTLLNKHRSVAMLSKYDSGSSPRFPKHCSYKKSLAMFLPLEEFSLVKNDLVPSTPSQIREVLIKNKMSGVTELLTAVYVSGSVEPPVGWRLLIKPWLDLVEI
ncbi:DUF7002 family protein [Paenibacillus aceris]|uniref:DUF4433 domain-containing protein n=1 Tax=Paenibacillus aceris TaxID=869555 RepID=A0ABS4I0P9_9BACL|nr:hypothetical protein [Paenibacillus aceris]MBP1964489.1 hypothetical protein [Paenibacillus aceris]NHW35801.1 hypothetical protein [Paenibacillus aceris]